MADAALCAIRRYAPDGRHLGDVGRRGERPGEFSGHLHGVRALADGSVIAWDQGLARVSRFHADGRLAGSFQVPSTGIVSGPRSLELDRSGVLHTVASVFRGTPPSMVRRDVWIRMTSEGPETGFLAPSRSAP